MVTVIQDEIAGYCNRRLNGDRMGAGNRHFVIDVQNIAAGVSQQKSITGLDGIGNGHVDQVGDKRRRRHI